MDQEEELLKHPLLQGVLPAHEGSDMTLVTRIRRIIENNEVALARLLLDKLPMWYHEGVEQTSQVFWSENHYIMSSSCEMLIREMLGLDLPTDLVSRVEAYLELKESLGLAEFLSPVYYPFTIAAVVNLFDFAKRPGIKPKCQAVLDRIAEQLLTVSLADGSIISPSGRSYARHRETTVGLHISVFITFLITKKNYEPVPGEPEQALREALRSTTYRASESVYRNFTNEMRDVELALSPRFDELLAFLEQHKRDLSLEDRVSLLWGHGAYLPPSYAAMADNLRFMDATRLWKHPHFRAAAPARQCLGLCCPLMCLSGCLVSLTSCCILRPFALGALLTGASLQVHREGKVILSSLGNRFNAGKFAFQQWPWAVNLNGVAIWSSFGAVGSGGLDSFGNQEASKEMSTARVMPLMRQQGNKLTALYLSSSCVLAIWNRSLRPRVRWPVNDFDEHGVEEVAPPAGGPGNLLPPSLRCGAAPPQPHVWRWARKGSAVVAQTVVGLEVRVVVRDLEVAGVTLEEFRRGIHEEFGARSTSPPPPHSPLLPKAGGAKADGPVAAPQRIERD